MERLREVLRKVDHRIFFAHKANRAPVFVTAAERAGIGVDVASEAELRTALQAGINHGRLEGSGPKSGEFVRTLVDSDIVLNVDSVWELVRAAQRARSLRRPARVLLRCSSSTPGRTSRFGMDEEAYRQAIGLVLADPDHLDLLGLSFHLDSVDLGERLGCLARVLTRFEDLHRLGLSPRVLNAGGGLPQVFLREPGDFDTYTNALRAGLIGAGPALTWNGTGLGYQVRDGVVQGVPVVQKFANRVTAAEELERTLTAPLPGQGGRSLARVLEDTMLQLWLEPGKALLDGAGVTVAGVQSVSVAGPHRLVVLNLGRDRLSPADQEFFVDPVLIGAHASGVVAEGVFLAGNLCLERDMITHRKVFLPRAPEPGDVLAFVNTAAYQMDLSAAPALGHPLLPKLEVVFSGQGFTATPEGADHGRV
nr:alanine racemase [Kineosporia babensis]